MRRFLMACAIVLAAPHLAEARPMMKRATAADLERLPSDPTRLRRLVAQYEAARLRVVRPAAGTDERAARLLLFPAAGSAHGAGGEFFRSDVTIVNTDDTVQDVLIVFLQNGASTSDPPTFLVDLNGTTLTVFQDMIGLMGIDNQIGALYVLPVDGPLGNLDLHAAIDGYSRIYTEQPGRPIGTVSQPFPAVDPYSFQSAKSALLMGLHHDSDYRANVGIVNLDDVPHTYTIEALGFLDQHQFTMTVPAMGMIQQPVPGGPYGEFGMFMEITPDDPNAPWASYASSTDNHTGDGWVSIASRVLTPEDLDAIDK